MDLESLGYEVIGTVDNGADAISIALEKFSDFVMMDIRLKGDVSGIEASEEINKYGIPIIYLTANTDDLTTFKVLKTVPYGYLEKPYSVRDVELTLKMAIKKNLTDIAAVIETEDKVREENQNL